MKNRWTKSAASLLLSASILAGNLTLVAPNVYAAPQPEDTQPETKTEQPAAQPQNVRNVPPKIPSCPLRWRCWWTPLSRGSLNTA